MRSDFSLNSFTGSPEKLLLRWVSSRHYTVDPTILCRYYRGIRLNAIKRFRLSSISPLLNVLIFPPPCLEDARKVRLHSDFSLNSFAGSPENYIKLRI